MGLNLKYVGKHCDGSESEWSCCVEKDANGGAATKTDYDYGNPLGVSSLTEWIYNLLGSVQGIVGYLAVIMRI